jgi:hypothetical protein
MMDQVWVPAASGGQPYILGGAELAPLLGAGQIARSTDVVLANLSALLYEQEQRYGNGEQPPVLVQQQPYDGPPLRYLLTAVKSSSAQLKRRPCISTRQCQKGSTFQFRSMQHVCRAPTGLALCAHASTRQV